MKWMLISTVSLLISCAVCKERKNDGAATTSDSLSTEIMDTLVESDFGRPISEVEIVGIEGIVRVNKNGCPLSIEMVEGDLFSIVSPVNLPLPFQIDGLKIEFNYSLDSAIALDGCSVDKIVKVSNVQLR